MVAIHSSFFSIEGFMLGIGEEIDELMEEQVHVCE